MPRAFRSFGITVDDDLLKVPLASRMSVKPALATRMPRIISPAGPSKLNSSIGNKPIRKIGNSGSTMNDSEPRVRMAVISYGIMDVATLP